MAINFQALQRADKNINKALRFCMGEINTLSDEEIQDFNAASREAEQISARLLAIKTAAQERFEASQLLKD